MRLAAFSIRTILSFIIGLMGMLALVLALLSGSIHRDLVFSNQRSMMEEMIGIEVKERLKDLKTTSRDLGLSFQKTSEFRDALKEKDQVTLVKLLNNQFHQYFVTADVIRLEQLILLDINLSKIAESEEGTVSYSHQQRNICPQLFDLARRRTGVERMMTLQDLCLYDNRPIYAVLVPVGGLRLKAYVLIITDPTHKLEVLESTLGMPLRLQLKNNKIVFQSEKWSAKEEDSLISSYELKTSVGIPILTILTAQNISNLSTHLHQARVDVLLITGVGTSLLLMLSIFIMRSTVLSPLNLLNNKLRHLHADESNIGEQLEAVGTKEIYGIIQGFNGMSEQLSHLYRSLEVMAYTDSLTKLPNRNKFQKSLEHFIQLHEKINKPFALFLMDLDRFKGVNDTLGHHVGDELLKAVSLRLHDVLRSNDFISRLDKEAISEISNEMSIVARLGGDEFSAIFANMHTFEDAMKVARKLIRAMEKPFEVNDHRLIIGLSIGIAMYPDHGNNMHSLVSHADIAMYDAKNRSCGFSIYDTKKNKNSLQSLRLEQDLFASIKKNELVLYYQPQISIADGGLIGAEALIRWRHPEHGLVPPDDFLPMAEQSGLMQPITEWVLNKALEDFSKSIFSENSLGISVNLSALNLRDERLPIIISDALKKWAVPSQALTLELTESTIMSDPEFSIGILSTLDAMGVTLSIDDFGTGHSSLAYVKKLPVDELKIDKSFIMGITKDSDNEAIVRAVLVLAHHMNLTVIAEGVEGEDELDRLRALGCDVAQGYYFARPMPFDEYIKWFEQNKHGTGKGEVSRVR